MPIENLGSEFARQHLANEWRVYAACRDPASAIELRRLSDDSDDKLRTLTMGVTDPDSIDTAATELDGQAIDLLLNNAGIIGPRGQTIGNNDYEAWAEVLAVNTMRPCGCPRRLPSMWQAANASSIVALGLRIEKIHSPMRLNQRPKRIAVAVDQ